MTPKHRVEEAEGGRGPFGLARCEARREARRRAGALYTLETPSGREAILAPTPCPPDSLGYWVTRITHSTPYRRRITLSH